MELFWKAVGAMLVTGFLGLAVAKKEFTVLMTMAAVCLGAVAVVQYLRPLLELLREVESMAALTDGVLGMLLKCTGIALVAELAEMTCRDTGSSSLGQMIRMLSGAAILYQSIPVVTVLLDLIRQILGEL